MTTASTPTVESFSIVCGPASSQPEVVIALGLFDPSADRLFMRFRPDLQDVISEEEMDVISATEEHFLTLVAENGATATVQWMEETLSNFVRFDGPKPVERPTDFEAALDGFYDQNINPKTERQPPIGISGSYLQGIWPMQMPLPRKVPAPHFRHLASQTKPSGPL